MGGESEKSPRPIARADGEGEDQMREKQGAHVVTHDDWRHAEQTLGTLLMKFETVREKGTSDQIAPPKDSRPSSQSK